MPPNTPPESLNPIITRPLPNAVVYDLTSPTQTTITLPPNSTWTSGLHYHTTHTEFLLLLHGSIRLRLGGGATLLTAPKSGEGIEITIPRFARHEWSRAGGDAEDASDVVVIERTDPADGAKSVFFWNLNGAILEFSERRVQGWYAEFWLMIELFSIFWALDNYPVFLDLSRFGGIGRGVEGCVTYLVLAAARGVGWIGGIDGVRRERMPRELWVESERRGKGKRG
ncbi:hypothetical protein BU16DRAFT_623489 [Lophium mytilinum]|uniref:Cupin 2 conserved barrel domain-containing protein n=1 Tax=Lophium mytilinum TaxID=390894 RepID=A0A6A6Q7M5_9PEZI|nr:hypothetical protein BU16DRAFT_623489 [Lophium mytilinum]